MNWKQRSATKELLDDPSVPFSAIRRNMQELNIINTKLGGHAITLKGLAKLVDGKLFQNPIRVLEIGCGGGDNLRALENWSQQKNIPLVLAGVDISEACINFARSQPQHKNIQFICADYRAITGTYDVVFSSLFCHHFLDAELVPMLRWMRQHARTGFFINDLHRHPVAYYSIKILTSLFSKSYLVKADAPRSVQRAFVRQDWHGLLKKSGIESYQISWQWAFRWLITCNT